LDGGQQAAQQALAEAHRALFLRLLSTPLHKLREDLMTSSGALQMAAGRVCGKPSARGPILLPPDLGAGPHGISIQRCTLFRFWSLNYGKGVQTEDAGNQPFGSMSDKRLGLTANSSLACL
jgi:hypothetical protein